MFSPSEDELLIQMVAQNPFLYNVALADHRNTFKRDRVWEEIANTLNRPGEGKECKNRWKNIKDTYFRQKRKNKVGPGYVHPKSKFEHYRRLLTFLEMVPTESAADEENPGPSHHQDQHASQRPDTVHSVTPTSLMGSPGPSGITKSSEHSENAETENHPSPQTEDSADGIPPLAGGKRCPKASRKKQDDVMRQARNRDMSRHKILRSLLTAKPSTEENEIDLFTRQANSVLRKLPTYLQIKAMHELFDVLTKYKMQAVESPPGHIRGASTSSYAYEPHAESTSFYLMDQSTPESSNLQIDIPDVNLGDEYLSPGNELPEIKKEDDAADTHEQQDSL